MCLSTKSNCIIACVYRPPNTDIESFSNLLGFISTFIDTHNKLDKLQIFLFGDFNFPQINWKSGSIAEYKTPSEVALNMFTNNFILSQYIQENTRKSNILDLFFSNNPNFAEYIKVNNVKFSDHNLIEIYTTFFPNLSTGKSRNTYSNDNLENDFSKLNLKTTNFVNANSDFSKVNWQRVFEGPIEDIPDKFNHMFSQF